MYCISVYRFHLIKNKQLKKNGSLFFISHVLLFLMFYFQKSLFMALHLLSHSPRLPKDVDGCGCCSAGGGGDFGADTNLMCFTRLIGLGGGGLFFGVLRGVPGNGLIAMPASRRRIVSLATGVQSLDCQVTSPLILRASCISFGCKVTLRA